MDRARLKASDRLQVDLGMDGDDAVEFFEAFEDRFGVDLSHLRQHWSEYFAEEVSSFSRMYWGALILIPYVLLREVFRLPEWVAILSCMAAVFGVLYVVARHNGKRERENPAMRQISVEDLIKSARTKSFTDSPTPAIRLIS